MSPGSKSLLVVICGIIVLHDLSGLSTCTDIANCDVNVEAWNGVNDTMVDRTSSDLADDLERYKLSLAPVDRQPSSESMIHRQSRRMADHVDNAIIAVSYNIRMDNPSDNLDNWTNRSDDMVAYLSTLKADFIGVQEALPNQLSYLTSGLTSHAALGVGRDDGLRGGEFSAILYDTSKWVVIQSNTFWLSDTPHLVSKGWDAACLRVVTYGIFTSTVGDTIVVSNTHLDHVGSEARAKSVELICGSLETYDHLPVVIMGDFNFTPDDKNYSVLDSQFDDAFAACAPSNPIIGTYNGFGTDETATRRIDYVWYSPALSCERYKVDRPKTSAQRQLSDHYPVIVHLKSPC